MILTINAKAFTQTLKQAATFTDPSGYPNVFIWSTETGCMAFATDGCNCYMRELSYPRGADFCVALTANEALAISRSVPKGSGKGLFDFHLPDTDGSIGQDWYAQLLEMRKNPIAHTVPVQGYPLSTAAWAKALAVYKDSPTVELRVYDYGTQHKNCVYCFSAIEVAEVWVLPTLQALQLVYPE